MSWLVDVAATTAYGFGSALIPIINAEAFAMVSVGARPWLLVPVVVALAVGQTCGKLVLFEAARRGSARFGSSKKLSALSTSKWSLRIRAALTNRRTAAPLVLASAGLGLPPLAFVSVAAGVAGQRRRTFAVMCLVGRTARFAVLAWPVAYAASLA